MSDTYDLTCQPAGDLAVAATPADAAGTPDAGTPDAGDPPAAVLVDGPTVPVDPGQPDQLPDPPQTAAPTDTPQLLVDLDPRPAVNRLVPGETYVSYVRYGTSMRDQDVKHGETVYDKKADTDPAPVTLAVLPGAPAAGGDLTVGDDQPVDGGDQPLPVTAGSPGLLNPGPPEQLDTAPEETPAASLDPGIPDTTIDGGTP